MNRSGLILTAGRPFATRVTTLIGGPRPLSRHWIEQRLIAIGRRKADLAEALQIDRSRVSELIHGRRRISVRELPTISRFLRIPIAEVVRLETGDPGFESDTAAERDAATARIYHATREALQAFSQHGLDEMTAAEIDSYATVIAGCAARAEVRDEDSCEQQSEPEVVVLGDFRASNNK